jgi:hypothetical protein
MRRVSSSACNIRAQSQVDGLLAAMNNFNRKTGRIFFLTAIRAVEGA